MEDTTMKGLKEAMKERVEVEFDDLGHKVYNLNMDEDDVYILAHELLTQRGLAEGDAEYEAEMDSINPYELIEQAENEVEKEAEDWEYEREYEMSLPFWR